MNLPKILSILKTEPLFCDYGYRFTLLEMFQEHAELSRDEFVSKRTGKARSGDSLDVEQAEKRGSVMIIPVGGPMGQGFGEFEKGAGCVDDDDLRAEIESAENDDEVENIILNFDTPGGMVTGSIEMCGVVDAVEKPIYAFTRGQLCSRGYMLATACDGIFATQTADVGCIGVCMSYMDLSKMADMMGIKIKVFGSGDYKGMGTPGTSLTPKHEMFLQQRIQDLAGMFYSQVRSGRGQIADEDMQGQTFKGNEALAKGFIDDIMPDLDSLISFLS